MKKQLFLGGGIAIASLVLTASVVLACEPPDPGPPPTCGDGELMLEEAPLIVETHEEHSFYYPGWPWGGHWGPWIYGPCPGGRNICKQQTVTDNVYWGDPVCTAVHPTCDPTGDCEGNTTWPSIKDSFDSNMKDIYGLGPQGLDETWVSVLPCYWNEGLEMCDVGLAYVSLKVKVDTADEAVKLGSYVVLVDGKEYAAEVVDGVDGMWLVWRAQVGGEPLYEGANVIASKDLIILDDQGKGSWVLWKDTNNAPVYKTSACQDPPDGGDTKVVDGVAMLSKQVGMTDFNVTAYLVANGVPYADAVAWVASDAWQLAKLGEYVALPPDSFVPLMPS
jgi:hypothetical protein